MTLSYTSHGKHNIINVGTENFMKIEMQCENIVFCLIPYSLNTQKTKFDPFTAIPTKINAIHLSKN
jgi:hypothetical protein